MSGVCWHQDGRRPIGHHCGDEIHILYGRCRSGRRWFWKACNWSWRNGDNFEREEHGFADTEQQALDDARAAVERIAAGRAASASLVHGIATDALKRLNAERRRQRPAPDTSDAGRVEYLYARDDSGHHWDGNQCGCDDLEGRAKWDYHTVRFRITKKTPKRIYYVRSERYADELEIGYVDRQKLEADGEVFNHGVHWSARDSLLYLRPPEPPPVPTPADQAAELSQLRAEMAAKHPDRGGTNAEFIEAHQRYLTAKGRAS